MARQLLYGRWHFGTASLGNMNTPPLKLLLSDFAHRTWGPRIAAAIPSGGLSFVTAEQAIAAGGPCEVDIAFMTREVTGKSSKNNQTPELRDLEIVLRRSPGL